MTHTVAIDFGTSRTKLAYWDPLINKPALMRLGHHEEPYIPSLFYLPSDSADVLWGENAEEMLEEDPAGIVDVLKRRLRDTHVYANRRPGRACPAPKAPSHPLPWRPRAQCHAASRDHSILRAPSRQPPFCAWLSEHGNRPERARR